MSELNLRPSGIEWEKEDLVVVTERNYAYIRGKSEKSSKVLMCDDDTFSARHPELSAHWVSCNIGYEQAFIDAQFVEDVEHPYVSLVKICCLNCSNVTEATEADASKPGLIDAGYATTGIGFYRKEEMGDWSRSLYMQKEVRLYQNRKMSVVYRVVDQSNGNDIVWVELDSFAKSNSYQWRTSGYVVDWIKDSDNWTDFRAHAVGACEDIRLVSTDEDVYKFAFSNTIKHKLLRKLFDEHTQVRQTDHPYGNPSRFHRIASFPTEFQSKLEEFLGVNDENNKDVLTCYNAKYVVLDYYIKRETSNLIPNICFLDAWFALKPSVLKAAKTQQDFLEDIVPRVTWEKGTCTWERMDDRYIVCSYYPAWVDDKEDYYGSNDKRIFIYDVKKKVRKVVEWQYRSENPTLAMPSLCDKILKDFDINKTEVEKWCAGGKKKFGPTKTVILGGLTPVELFKGTNLEWMIQNQSAFGDDFKFVMASSRWDYENINDFKEEITGDFIGIIALAVLATSGDRLLEQLLKSKLFKMYFMALWAQSSKRKVFLDLDKTYAAHYDYNFGYHGKAKNLKDMFGMSMNQLRKIEAQITIDEAVRSYDDRKTYFYNNIPSTKDIDRALQLTDKGLTALDDKTFMQAINIGSGRARGNRWGRKNVFTSLCEHPTVWTLINAMTMSEKVKYLAGSTSDDIEAYADYLQMRGKMAAIQAAKPEETIFDEVTYPEKVGKANKFIMFIPGMTRCDRTWNNVIKTPNEFQDYIHTMYDRYVTDTDAIKIVPDDDGNLGGMSIKMNTIMHMKFLHDEMSRWYAFYEDESKQILFEHAVKRVLPLEWTDEEYGLSIVAPRTPQDIKDEGRILAHCVASYVDPIINGTENVVFIRRNDMIGSPYFTMDVVDGNVRQIHCYRNGNVTNEDIDQAYANSGLQVYNKHMNIMDFLLKWAKAMKGRINIKNIRSHSGCYGAHR